MYGTMSRQAEASSRLSVARVALGEVGEGGWVSCEYGTLLPSGFAHSQDVDISKAVLLRIDDGQWISVALSGLQ